MDTSGLPALCLVSESLTRAENNTSILWCHQPGGFLAESPRVMAVPILAARARTPASTNQEHREAEGGGRWKKIKDWPGFKLEQQQVLSWVCWQAGSALVPACGQGFPPAALVLLDLKFRWGWQGSHGLKEFEHEMRLQKQALNSSSCLQSSSAFQLPLASHSAHQLWLHRAHSGCLSKLD